MDLITQDSYEKRGKQSTIPPALAKEKEIKKEPIQKLQPRNNRKKTEIPTKNLNCGFCGQQNWSPSHKCKNGRKQHLPQNGHFARVCRSKTNNNTKTRNQLPGRNIHRRGRKRTRGNTTNHTNQQSITR